MNPKISVVIPTYNRKQLITRSIDSVLNQTFQDFELIIVDDCSTDGTGELIASYQDPRIVYIRNNHNLGAGGSRNAGAAIAGGEYIAFQDSDDEWLPDKLEKQMAMITTKAEYSGKKVGMVYCEHWNHVNGESVIFPWASIPEENKSGDIFSYLLYSPLISTQTMLVKRSVWQQVGGFSTKINSLEDWEFSIRVAREHAILLAKEPLVKIYATAEGVNHNQENRFQSEFYILQKYQEYYSTAEALRTKFLGIVKRNVRQENKLIYRDSVLNYLNWLLQNEKYQEAVTVLNIPETIFLNDETLNQLRKAAK